MILRNWRSASSMPAAVQRRHMSPFCQRLTLRLMRRTVSIIDSHGFVEASVRLSRPRTPRRVTVSVSSMPSRSDAAAPGCDAGELVGEHPQLVERAVVVVERPRGPQPAAHERPVALGQVAEHVALLVADAALHRRVDAEHVADGLAQRLGAVDDDQHALLDIQAALDEVGQQRGRDGGVLGRPVPQPERVLDAVGVDPERDDAAAALELDPVEHQHRQAQVVERAATSARSGARACATRTRG